MGATKPICFKDGWSVKSKIAVVERKINAKN
ncbi:hypothetical protein CCACVL1_14680 [Corchorus capsularis]|uniref:Uncharacterized protein n=1 Tax=Corchorus capsularis TaxID=210143 RepID=A0A1R3I659_COCAP|nr:hypothetical protein CCACVL1_14680 [Corchorus capsularis]